MGSKKMGLIMEIFPLFCLFVGIIHCDSGHPNHPECWMQCGVLDHVIANITCTDSECECQKPQNSDFTCADFTSPGDQDLLTHHLTWIECQKLAQDGKNIDGLANEYFRWENHPAKGQTICYLLDKCPKEDSLSAHCAPFDEAPCVSGLTESCDPEPASFCDHATWAEDGLHWTCL